MGGLLPKFKTFTHFILSFLFFSLSKMPTELVTVNLTRENEKEEWGFILTGGGRDKDVRLFIEQVKPGSIAEKVGLKVKDSLVKIGNDCALDYTRDEAMESLKRGKDFFDMIVERMSSQGCPQVDRHGSHAFVKWQHQQQQLYKKMYPCQNSTSQYISRYTSKGCPQVDRHGSHLFVQWQRQQQQLNPVINRTGSIGFVLKQRELQSLNRTTIDRVGSLGFVQLQRKQQQLYKQKMNGVAGKNDQQRCAPKKNTEKMEQRHPQVDRHGSDQFIEWQKQQQQKYKQMKLKNPPKVDRNGSHDFVEWQQKQQELYKEMNGVAEKKSLKQKIVAEPTWKV